MKIVRVIEVWEKDLDGAFVGYLPVADTLSLPFLFGLFAHEQDRPDPEMKLSYMLDARRIEALQPWVAQQMDAAQFDYILTAHRYPDQPA
ncbi:hypothetical protein [Amantichitinum ursilacus]|uniref:Uncharacterized protein n=1 Tax=Amantichitinum ursilacus TaxID=857265 RepID=A0A0N1JRE9_9NEIS|nr:hypothetical protein [Amantichitinum ursilacus]KPC49373.1 hypothetical protein WG78_20800 [Amantichitinum ursilacus]